MANEKLHIYMIALLPIGVGLSCIGLLLNKIGFGWGILILNFIGLCLCLVTFIYAFINWRKCSRRLKNN